jgi:hypothetical protein
MASRCQVRVAGVGPCTARHPGCVDGNRTEERDRKTLEEVGVGFGQRDREGVAIGLQARDVIALAIEELAQALDVVESNLSWRRDRIARTRPTPVREHARSNTGRSPPWTGSFDGGENRYPSRTVNAYDRPSGETSGMAAATPVAGPNHPALRRPGSSGALAQVAYSSQNPSSLQRGAGSVISSLPS